MFATQRTWKTPLVISLAGTALAGALVMLACSSLSSATPAPPRGGPGGGIDGAAELLSSDSEDIAGPEDGADPGDGAVADGPAGAELLSGDGSIDDENGIAVDADHAAITGLAPELRDAVQAAAARAAEEGVELRVTSGWRSAELQRTLLSDAIGTYGDESEARRWVDTPERSKHVTGDAIDIGGLEAALWVGQYGSEFGLCQTYANESWHYELSTEPGGECPAMLDDSSEG